MTSSSLTSTSPRWANPLRYHNAKKRCERLSEAVGFSVSPHIFRHSAATRWLESGAPRDVIQAPLGHVSPASMSVYFLSDERDDEGCRRACEIDASRWRRWLEAQRLPSPPLTLFHPARLRLTTNSCTLYG